MCHKYRNHNIERISVIKEKCQASQPGHVRDGKRSARRSYKWKYTQRPKSWLFLLSLIPLLQLESTGMSPGQYKTERKRHHRIYASWTRTNFLKHQGFQNISASACYQAFLFFPFVALFPFPAFYWTLRSQLKVPSEEQRTKVSKKLWVGKKGYSHLSVSLCDKCGIPAHCRCLALWPLQLKVSEAGAGGHSWHICSLFFP